MALNPFEVTKAVDFSDQEIERNYVRFAPQDSGTQAILEPSSPMPHFLVGGKGGGRTHLMRHYSYPLQKLRGLGGIKQVRAEGYVGIYFRCSGLNGSRFAGKRQSEETWHHVYAYYMDVWLTELTFATLVDLDATARWSADEQHSLAKEFSRIVGSDVGATLTDCLKAVVELRRALDREINQAALTGRLDVTILTAPGEMVFGVAKSSSDALSQMEDLKITFLVDEYENLTFSQQKYFNTLLREKVLPCTFLIGGRQWGVRTHATLSANEVNRQGSEYETVVIEDAYRSQAVGYGVFCRELVSSRLRDAGLSSGAISKWFERLNVESDGGLQSEQLREMLARYSPLDRPHLVRLRDSIRKATRDDRLAASIVARLANQEHPLVEKLAILRFYQLWSSRGVSHEAADLAVNYVQPLLDGTDSSGLRNFLNQRKGDALAQVYRDADRSNVYSGFDQFVDMSGFLPRSLLMILKYITRWALFFGEDPLKGSVPISPRALSAGVLDASRWFFSDAKPMGTIGDEVEVAMRRMGSFLSKVRFSDKPAEISVNTFSSNLQGVSPGAMRTLNTCVEHGLLVELPSGRVGRNDGPQHRRFQIHPMLTPLWSLSPGRRGDLTLRSDLVGAIFDPAVSEEAYLQHAKYRLDPMNAPFLSEDEGQGVLFELD